MTPAALHVVLDGGPSTLDYLTFAAALVAVVIAAWAAIWTRRQGLAAQRQARAAVGPAIVIEYFDEDGCELTNRGGGLARIQSAALGRCPLKLEHVIVAAGVSVKAVSAPRTPDDAPSRMDQCVIYSTDFSGVDHYISLAWRPAGSGIALVAGDIEGPLTEKSAKKRLKDLHLH